MISNYNVNKFSSAPGGLTYVADSNVFNIPGATPKPPPPPPAPTPDANEPPGNGNIRLLSLNLTWRVGGWVKGRGGEGFG